LELVGATHTFPQRRTSPRAEVALGCRLARRRGGPITGSTVDIGNGGMRVRTERPLAVDERLDFDLDLAAGCLRGGARVLREQAPRVYALRFEDLGVPEIAMLNAFVTSRVVRDASSPSRSA
jgi:hypothetical protein